jgi:hypothetical protein
MITLIKLNLVHKKYVNDMESLIRVANRLKIIVIYMFICRIRR